MGRLGIGGEVVKGGKWRRDVDNDWGGVSCRSCVSCTDCEIIERNKRLLEISRTMTNIGETNRGDLGERKKKGVTERKSEAGREGRVLKERDIYIYSGRRGEIGTRWTSCKCVEAKPQQMRNLCGYYS